MIEIAASPARISAVAGIAATLPTANGGGDIGEMAAFGALLAAQPGMSRPSAPLQGNTPLAIPPATLTPITAQAAKADPAILPPTGKTLPEAAVTSTMPRLQAGRIAITPAGKTPVANVTSIEARLATGVPAEPAVSNGPEDEQNVAAAVPLAEPLPDMPLPATPDAIVAALFQPTVVVVSPVAPQSAATPATAPPVASPTGAAGIAAIAVVTTAIVAKPDHAPRTTGPARAGAAPQRQGGGRTAAFVANPEAAGPAIVSAVIERVAFPAVAPASAPEAALATPKHVSVTTAQAATAATATGPDQVSPLQNGAATLPRLPAGHDKPAAESESVAPTEHVLPAFVAVAPAITDPAPAAPTVAARAPERIDFATLVDSIARARDDAAITPVSVAVSHTEFGKVSLQFQTHEIDGSGGLSVAMASADPGFAPAVAAASEAAAASNSDATNRDPGQQRGDAQPQQRSQSSTGDARGQAQAQAGNGESGRQDQQRPGRGAESQRPAPRAAPDDASSAGIFA